MQPSATYISVKLVLRHAFFFLLTYLFSTEPGTITFEKRGYLVKESCGDAEIAVLRQNGADGEISIKWR